MAAVDGLDFDPLEFREGIRMAMTIGLPVEEEDRPVFVFPGGLVVDEVTDPDGIPMDWRGASESGGEDVRVLATCAVEYLDAAGEMTGFGNVSPSRVLLTLLDEDYATIKGFSYVVIGGTTYKYQRTVPPLGMVDVGVYQVYCRTDDEG